MQKIRSVLILALSLVMLLALSAPAAAQGAMEEGIRAGVQRVIDEAFNQGNLAILDERFSPDYLAHPDETGLEEFKASISALRAAMPDLHATADPLLVEGNWAAFRFHLTGTFTNPYVTPQGTIPPSGNALDVHSNLILRFDDEGRAVEEWDAFDTLALLEQFGVIPASGTVEDDDHDEHMEMTPMAAMMSGMEDTYKQITTAQLEAFNSEDYAAYLADTAEGYMHTNPLGTFDAMTLQGAFGLVYSSMPDHNLTIDQMVAEGDWVATAYTVDGTFTGTLAVPGGDPIPGNGNALHITGIIFTHFNEEGKIDEEWDIFDRLSFFTQLGLMGGMATPEAAAS